MATRTALVTGATAGIGAEFARQLAGTGWDLVLVARDASRLAAFAAELTAAHGGQVDTLPADLSTDDGVRPVAARLGERVDLLVNNAGIGLNVSFTKADVAEESRLLRLNVDAVMRLTHAVLPGMIARQHGAVINVSSVAGFGAVQPGSTYAATKAWVTNFSESIGLATRRHNVRVMALCPGFTRTEFHQRAGINTASSPKWMWLRADDVVKIALRDLRRGKLVSVPDWRYKSAVFALRHLPRPVLHAVSGGGRRRLGRELS